MSDPKLTVNEFADRLAAAVDVGAKIDALASQIAELRREIRNTSPPRTTSPDELKGKLAYTCREAAEQLSVHVHTVYLWIRQGYLPVVQLGGARRVQHVDLQRLLKHGTPKVWADRPGPAERERKKVKT